MMGLRGKAIADKTDKWIKIMWKMHISSQVMAESRPRLWHTRKNSSRHILVPAHERSVQVSLFYVDERTMIMESSTLTSDHFIHF